MQDGQNSNTRQAEAAEGLAIVESLWRGRLPARVFPLEWECAEKGFLAHLQRIGLGGGFGAALLVGGIRHHSRRLCELVGGLSQRLVLKRPRALVGDCWLALFRAGFPSAKPGLHREPWRQLFGDVDGSAPHAVETAEDQQIA